MKKRIKNRFNARIKGIAEFLDESVSLGFERRVRCQAKQ